MGAPAQRADALVGICRYYLAEHVSDLPGRASAKVAVLVRYEDMASGGPGRASDGTVLSGEEVQRASCGSVLHRLVYSGRSAVLDFGAGARTISNSLCAALVARDGHCRHPGCDRPAAWCEGHHVVHFSQGGHTKLSNLVLSCARHHHIWHKGWQLTLHEDGVLELVSPAGELFENRPPRLTSCWNRPAVGPTWLDCRYDFTSASRALFGLPVHHGNRNLRACARRACRRSGIKLDAWPSLATPTDIHGGDHVQPTDASRHGRVRLPGFCGRGPAPRCRHPRRLGLGKRLPAPPFHPGAKGLGHVPHGRLHEPDRHLPGRFDPAHGSQLLPGQRGRPAPPRSCGVVQDAHPRALGGTEAALADRRPRQRLGELVLLDLAADATDAS